MKAFKAYDIRGEWGTDLNEDIAYRIGYFLPDMHVHFHVIGGVTLTEKLI